MIKFSRNFRKVWKEFQKVFGKIHLNKVFEDDIEKILKIFGKLRVNAPGWALIVMKIIKL